MNQQKPGLSARVVKIWRENSLFSISLALLLMVILQTFALGFNYASLGAWLSAWSGNWVNILRNNAVVGMIALGMTFVIITGGIDLAVGSLLVGVGTILMVMLDTTSSGVLISMGITGAPAIIIAIVVALAAGVLVGLITGATITKGRVPPFIVTLGTMNIIRSVAQNFMQGRPLPKMTPQFLEISNAIIFGQRIMPIIYWFLTAAILYTVSKRTRFGRHVFAVGSNQRTTRLSGINVDRVKMMVYSLMGGIVAIASIVESSRMGSMNTANAGLGYELDAIAAVIVGGTRMSGGKGSIIGTVIGMLIIGVMNNLLNLIGVPPVLRNACKGAIVIAAVLLQRKEAE